MGQIEFAKGVLPGLKRVEAKAWKQIFSKLLELSHGRDDLDVKKLATKENRYRLRVGDYRVVFEPIGDLIFVHSIGIRGKIYKEL